MVPEGPLTWVVEPRLPRAATATSGTSPSSSLPLRADRLVSTSAPAAAVATDDAASGNPARASAPAANASDDTVNPTPMATEVPRNPFADRLARAAATPPSRQTVPKSATQRKTPAAPQLEEILRQLAALQAQVVSALSGATVSSSFLRGFLWFSRFTALGSTSVTLSSRCRSGRAGTQQLVPGLGR